MQTALHLATLIAAAFVFDGCVSSASRPQVQFSGVTREDVREIELLVAQRADILKPVISVDVMNTIPASHPLNGEIEVISGHADRLGDTSDRFMVAKRHGRWAITSPIERESIVVTGH